MLAGLVGYDDSSDDDSSPVNSGVGGIVTYDHDSDDDDNDHDAKGLALGDMGGAHITVGETLPARPSIIREPRDQWSVLRKRCLLPPPPCTPCKPGLQAKIVAYLDKDANFNYSLQCNKQFHNPSILDQIAQLYEIDQTSSNYPKDLYNPKNFAPGDFYDQLSQAQKLDEERRERERKSKPSAVALAQVAAQKKAKLVAANHAAGGVRSRRNKWDSASDGSKLPTTAKPVAAVPLASRPGILPRPGMVLPGMKPGMPGMRMGIPQSAANTAALRQAMSVASRLAQNMNTGSVIQPGSQAAIAHATAAAAAKAISAKNKAGGVDMSYINQKKREAASKLAEATLKKQKR